MAIQKSVVILGRGAFDVSDQTRGLVLRLEGGTALVNKRFSAVANPTLELPDDATSYVEINAAGVVSSNTTSFTSGRGYLYKVVTSGGEISEIQDWRHDDRDAVVTASAGAAPAGGTGVAAGAYDTAANRDALITLVNAMRTALINNGLLT
jgi:hypothetical protein